MLRAAFTLHTHSTLPIPQAWLLGPYPGVLRAAFTLHTNSTLPIPQAWLLGPYPGVPHTAFTLHTSTLLCPSHRPGRSGSTPGCCEPPLPSSTSPRPSLSHGLPCALRSRWEGEGCRPSRACR